MKKLFNKLGMTYVEMLVALALLSLIVVSFTPMLLSSYETIYNAGEKIQKNYNSREEIEEGLARRDSSTEVDINLDLKVNASTLFDQINVSGHKVVSTFAGAFETVFGQVRPRVQIVSGNTVFDDQPNHDITLQTKGMKYQKIEFGKFHYSLDDNATTNKLPEDTIFLQVTMPDKQAGDLTNEGADANTGSSTEDAVYAAGTILTVSVEGTTANGSTLSFDSGAINGRFKINVGHPDLDFTYSPVQVKVYYVNNRGKTRFATDYLYIDPATIIFAGDTNGSVDYYTSPGVEEFDTSGDGSYETSEYKLVATPRKMRTGNSHHLLTAGQYNGTALGAPGSRDGGVRINAVKWIDNDETAGIKPYYVMVGTDGSIYRMYNFSSSMGDLYGYATGATVRNTATGYFNGGKPYLDNIYSISNGSRVYPSLWGGDFSHVFEFSSAQKRTAYGKSENNDCDQVWITSVGQNGLKGDPNYDVMSSQAQFCYFYNGNATSHKYNFKNARPISYIITERGWPIRLWGIIGPIDDNFIGDLLNSTDLFADYTALWDKSNTSAVMRDDKVYTDSSEVLAFHYKHLDSDWQIDNAYAGLRIKSLTSYSMPSMSMRDRPIDPFDGATDPAETIENAKLETVRHSNGEVDNYNINNAQKDINITDVIYIPGTDNTVGSTFYVGSIHAYANVIQTDKVSHDYRHGQKKSHKYKYKEKFGVIWIDKSPSVDPIEASNLYDRDFGKDSIPDPISMKGKWYRNQGKDADTSGNQSSYPLGKITDYLIMSSPDGTATYIAKRNDTDFDRDAEWASEAIGKLNAGSGVGRGCQFVFWSDYINKNDASITKENAASKGFYVNHDADSNAKFFFPSHGINEYNGSWDKHMYLSDVSFTFGYASNRERVYTNITYDGTVEYNRSFERLYWRSEYAQDATYYKEKKDKTFDTINSNQSIYSGTALNPRQQQRAVGNGNGGSNSGDANLNSYNNDYYNVWFPGEMYNLNKVVSKDGVTVAVGFAVAGSAYQYAHTDTSATSTALGGVYNDGVLSAMIEGKDNAFVNLLYFKDNETFDGSSLSNSSLDAIKNRYTSADYGSKGYGTHKRDSVQFIAVDILVESKNTATSVGDSSELSYYAYYGDNKGRVFRSLVATGTGRSVPVLGDDGNPLVDENGDPVLTVDSSVELVPFIKSKTATLKGTVYGDQFDNNTKDTIGGVENVPYSSMEEIKVSVGNTQKPLSDYFSRIGTIDIKDEIIIITGAAKTKGAFETIVIGIKDADTGVWTYYAVQNGTFTGIINDACIVGSYYYIVGSGGGTSKPWIAAVPLETLKNVALSDTKVISAASGNVSSSKDDLIWIETDVELFAIAGRDTK